MPSSTTNRDRIRNHSWEDLQRLLEQIQSGDSPDWKSGKAFEHLVLRAFELDDEKPVVRYPYEVWLYDQRVEEIDGAVHLPGLSCLIECKDWEGDVPITPVAKMRNQLLRRPAGVFGVLFARNRFTDPAKLLAHFSAPQSIVLWSGDEIEFALAKRKMAGYLRAKCRMWIEEGIPDFDIRSPEQP